MTELTTGADKTALECEQRTEADETVTTPPSNVGGSDATDDVKVKEGGGGEMTIDERLSEAYPGHNFADGYDETDYIPDFILDVVSNPPILEGESADAFEALFESIEYSGDHRPKSDYEYILVLQMTTASFELLRYDRMKAAIQMNSQRVVVDTLHRRLKEMPSTKDDVEKIAQSARKGTVAYFTDPEYRKSFAETLKRNGYGPHSVEGDAFLRSLPSLATIDRLIASTEKRLATCKTKLDAAYALRKPQQPMPISYSASRATERYRKILRKNDNS